MEIDSNLIIHHDLLEASDILRIALTISATNINFFIFTILTSIPLFCFLVYNEPFLQRFILEISEIPSHNDNSVYKIIDSFGNFGLSIPSDITAKLHDGFVGALAQIGLVYLIPLHLLELSTILVIVDLASKTYVRHDEEDETRPPLSLKEMILKPFHVTRVIGTLVTFACSFIISSCSLLALVWLAATCYVVTMFMRDGLVVVWSWVGFAGLVTMYLGWSAAWNMSVVIAILEGRYGTKAMALAVSYSVGNEGRGCRLMLVFFAWEVCLRLPCIYFGFFNETWSVGNLTQIGLCCLGNVVKWVAFTIYYYDCRNREMKRRLVMKSKKRGVESA